MHHFACSNLWIVVGFFFLFLNYDYMDPLIEQLMKNSLVAMSKLVPHKQHSNHL